MPLRGGEIAMQGGQSQLTHTVRDWGRAYNGERVRCPGLNTHYLVGLEHGIPVAQDQPVLNTVNDLP
jgi:hypothetical protein